MKKSIICFMVLAICFFSACTTTTEEHHPTVHKYTIEYKVTGTVSQVFITYENSSEGTSQEYASVPWTYSFSADAGQFLYVSAQNQDDSETITVEIYRDGHSFKTSTSTGAYVIATASGLC